MALLRLSRLSPSSPLSATSNEWLRESAAASVPLEMAVSEGVFTGPSWGCSSMESLMMPVVVELGVDEEESVTVVVELGVDEGESVTAPAPSGIAVLVSVFTASLASASR